MVRAGDQERREQGSVTACPAPPSFPSHPLQDSLELLSNLLRGNPSNQVFLRETIGLSKIPHLLAVAPPGGTTGPGGKGGGDARDAGAAVGALVQGLGADGEAFGVSRQKVC